VTDVERHRRIDCAELGACLESAVIGRWPGFHCGDCAAYRQLTPEERAADGPALVALGLKIRLGEDDAANDNRSS
jgi:hypothetical protein